MKNRPYIPAPIQTDNIELPKDILLLSERIAENVHETWAAARISEGWTWGAERNDALRHHPCLVPYCELPESDKEYDRKTAMETLRLILKLGYSIKKAE